MSASLPAARSRRQPRLDLPGVSGRAWTTADAAALVLAHRDPLVRRYATTLLDDRPTAQATLAGWSRLWADGGGAAWAVVEPGDVVVGGVVLAIRDAVSGRGEAGYWLLPGARGRGLATAALAAASDVAFGVLAWHRVDVSHAVGNERSCSVARRAGYRPEAVLREAQFYPDAGTWSDEHLHARLAP